MWSKMSGKVAVSYLDKIVVGSLRIIFIWVLGRDGISVNRHIVFADIYQLFFVVFFSNMGYIGWD